MRVLVDGDRGYIGAVLVPLLLEAGHDVEGLDAGWYDGCDFGEQPSGYRSRTGDIRDVTADDLAGFDAVIHLAAVSNDPVGHLNPEATFSVNAEGAAHVARADDVQRRRHQKREPGWRRNSVSSGVEARPRMAFRCGKRPKRAITPRWRCA